MRGLILAAGGASTRFGGDDPKVLVPLQGRTVLARALDAFLAIDGDWDVVIAAPAALQEAMAQAAEGRARVVVGGATRQASVAAGLAALDERSDPILVHDAARPLVTAEVIHRVLHAIETDGAAVAVLPAVDSLHIIAEPTLPGTVTGTLERAYIMRAQTPQGARRALLMQAFREAEADSTATDEVTLLRASGIGVTAVLGDPHNAKITTRDDLEAAQRWLAKNNNA